MTQCDSRRSFLQQASLAGFAAAAAFGPYAIACRRPRQDPEPSPMPPDATLVDRAIAQVRSKGLGCLGARSQPVSPQGLSTTQLSRLRLPGDKPLSPAMRAWLAFDAQWLGWFEDLSAARLRPLKVAALARQEYGDQPLARTFESLEAHSLAGDCLLVPIGSESRRFVYLSEPDDTGEYPVLLIDIDDQPFVCVEYPGLDVYLATHAGVLQPPANVYGAYVDDPRFAGRMRHHIQHALHGERQIELHSAGFPFDPAWNVSD